ncbi:hypothetical protein NEUTE1DRAFT_41133 [Neurospora tetrasperma FGSC 2508]|uniref:Uncharacterized protein n=1 Tax=Neurospora tetrasperma (strain FGSC 2508 / ATCC MYA-4615 / P0657) TaxID=510951 RepID=F8MLY9_NEUT8|nr:uncharacterized protein NEUTE1DRAFT_41133 [Neurospora tetrasperma FGSC 2508]EGO58504.1 hypothetical protein NEUTE1DRAFT_41133 [Neurospora tetrasperma FGSC 2508]EGZ71156.1 hypothetical protein NEUTE2DRAFT_66393 [Neurospora tetrasperma FGSC 2509]
MCRVGYTYKYCLNGENCHSDCGWQGRNGGLYPRGGYSVATERLVKCGPTNRPPCIRSRWRHDTYLDGRTSDEYCPACLRVGETSGDRWYYHR